MRVLVLGGTRFIGLRLVWLLSELGHDVTVLNRGQTEAVLPDKVTRIICDRADTHQIQSLLRDSYFDVAFDISSYTTETLKPVVEVLKDRVGHFVFCSTTLVYPPADIIPIRESFPRHIGGNVSKYSSDKIECENFLFESFEKDLFPATILRPPYVYGPYNHIKEREFSYFARVTRKRKVIVPGDGLTFIHPIHVDDLASAFVSVSGKQETFGEAYTICSPDAVTINGYVRVISEIVGFDSEIVNIDANIYKSLNLKVFPYEWEAGQVYSIEKAIMDLKWKPKYCMREGLEMTYRWWLDHGSSSDEWDFSEEDKILSQLS